MGDMYSLEFHYDQVILEHPNVSMSAQAFTLEIICRTANKNNVILEAFQDKTGYSRLQLYNLEEDVERNTLFYEEKSIIWVPTMIFLNTRNRVYL